MATNPAIPQRNVRWGLDNFLTMFTDWTVWGGLTEIADRNVRHDSLTSEIVDAILDLEARGTMVISTEQYRPDLIARKMYNSIKYWQVILLYNGIVDIGTLKAGTTLVYPSLQELEGLLLLRAGKKLPVEEVTIEEDELIKYGGETPLHNEVDVVRGEIRYSDLVKTGRIIKVSGHK